MAAMMSQNLVASARRLRSIVIIGAPRSGTNMLRDLLCGLDSMATWPCDEINYIWRFGNARHPSDEFTADMATPRVRKYIRRQFDWVRRKYDVRTVVEKTCANSLRVEFVERVLGAPEYIFIYRNGMDVVASAVKRWRASMDIPYLLQKARFVPARDLPYYGLKFLRNRLAQLRSPERRLSVWGPISAEIALGGREMTLEELCALQWRHCVERSISAFESIPAERLHTVAYESLVGEKTAEGCRLAEFLGIDSVSLLGLRQFEQINDASVGRGPAELRPDALNRVCDIVAPTLARLGYK